MGNQASQSNLIDSSHLEAFQSARQALAQVEASLTSTQKTANATEESMQRLTKAVGGGLTQALSSLPGAEFFKNPSQALLKGVGTVTQMGMAAEKTALSFGSLAGSQEKANQLLAECARYAQDTPYSKLGVENAAKSMLELGVTSDKVCQNLRILGDMAMGEDRKLNDLAVTFSRISKAGKLQSEDLQELKSLGYDPLKDISELTGYSVSELMKGLEEGALSAEVVTGAFQKATSEGGQFYHTTEKLANSPLGALETTLDTFRNTLLNLYQIIQPFLIPAFDILTQMLWGASLIFGGIGTVVGGFFDLLGNGNPILWGIVGVVEAFAIAAGIAAVATKVWSSMQLLFNNALNANPLLLTLSVIIGLVAAVGACWKKFAGFRAFILTMWEVIKGFGNILKEYVVNRIKGLLEGVGAMGSALKKLFAGDFKGAASDALRGFAQMSGVEAGAKALNRTGQLLGGTGETYRKILAEEKQKETQKKQDSTSIPDFKNVPIFVPKTDKKPSKTGEEILQPGEGELHGSGNFSGYGTERGTSSASALSGGNRTTPIQITIGKFFDSLNVYMEEALDTRQIEDIVTECLTRSLAIATSTES